MDSIAALNEETVITTASGDHDLMLIIGLQDRNHLDRVLSREQATDGFVTVRHSLEILREMNAAAPQVVAKKGGEVVGFALVMLPKFRDAIPVLRPMFDQFGSVLVGGRPISEHRYYVMGQICVAEASRGSGVFDRMYAEHKALFSNEFDLCVTEISSSNLRSLRAHSRVGFRTVARYRDTFDEWDIVAWDWE